MCAETSRRWCGRVIRSSEQETSLFTAHCPLVTDESPYNLNHRRRHIAGDFLSDCQTRHPLGRASDHRRRNPGRVDWSRNLLVVGQPACFTIAAVKPSTLHTS